MSCFTRDAPDVALVRFCLESLILRQKSYRIFPAVFKPICHDSMEEVWASTLSGWCPRHCLLHTSVCAGSLHSHDSVPLRHGSRALTCCERVGHPAPSEVSRWVCKEHGCFLNRPSNSASALHPPSHDPLTPQHFWDSAVQICLPPGFLHRHWCGDSSFHPQAFCF